MQLTFLNIVGLLYTSKMHAVKDWEFLEYEDKRQNCICFVWNKKLKIQLCTWLFYDDTVEKWEKAMFSKFKWENGKRKFSIHMLILREHKTALMLYLVQFSKSKLKMKSLFIIFSKNRNLS